MKAYTTVHTRIGIKADRPEMVRIERGSFEFPWNREDFDDTLKNSNIVTFVAEHNEIVGYVIAEVYADYIQVLNLAVAPEHRQCGIGTQLLRRLVEKLTDKRTRISAAIRETNLTAQQFFKAMEFRATKVVKGLYDNTEEDSYLMEYRTDWTPDGYEVLRSIMQNGGKVIHATSV